VANRTTGFIEIVLHVAQGQRRPSASGGERKGFLLKLVVGTTRLTRPMVSHLAASTFPQ
jgi:hypothetical protein